MGNMYDQQISLLNSLIEINHDRIEGYRKAATMTEDADLKRLFTLYSYQSSNFVKELGEYVHAMGGLISDHTTASGKMYRVWMDIKSIFDGKDRKGILECCEFAEKSALNVYTIFLSDQDSTLLPLECIAIIEDQRTLIDSAYTELRNLRELLEKLS